MKTSHILVFSCEAGGAEVLAPVVNLLAAQRAYRVVVASYGHGQRRFARRGIKTVEVKPLREDDETWPSCCDPDILITSATSLPTEDMTEKHLWRFARRRGIPSLAFLDQWQNYALRFSGPCRDAYLKYQPDYINCINRIGLEEMQAIGLPSEKLLPLGHPYLDRLKSEATTNDPALIREHMGIRGASNVFLFVSEPILEYCGYSRGYDQYTVLERFIACFRHLPDPPTLIVKLHPKDRRERYPTLVRQYASARIRILRNEFSPLACLLAADRVFGMSSIMLLEAFALGKPVVSLQPGLSVDDPCVLSKYGHIPRIDKISADHLCSAAVSSILPFDFAFDASAFLDLVARSIRTADLALPAAETKVAAAIN